MSLPSFILLTKEREMLPYCKFHGIGVIPWAPLATGILARPVGTRTTRTAQIEGSAWERKLSDADAVIVNRVEEVAKKKGWSMSEVALAWCKTKVVSPIVGITSVSAHAFFVRGP